MSDKPAISFGDIVRIDGYGQRLFRVETYEYIRYHSPEHTDDEWVYDLTALDSGEFMVATDCDLELVADAGQADEYLRANPVKPAVVGWRQIATTPKEPPKPTARELSAQEADKRRAQRKARADQVDNLLDRRSWYAKSEAVDKDERLAEIDAELRKLKEA
ncbi:hypothetical protein [Cytobacillus gottheilii]|uniref:Uncharacterized protein n=1 Tax=Cytobacillus gottheilii TaxID=859144 RepID=A0ABX8FFY4_9BACI|nr:hypothetical protein [Cytobacillus gottheilii]QVY62944.1 hypothetical protein J1899_07840 [Cytobacillus gottheilii]